MKLILVRHGAAEHTPMRCYAGCGTDSDLIDEGYQEAEAAAEALRELQPGIVWSGPLVRQKKTADIIAQSTGSDRRIVQALNELDFGTWEGMTKDSIARKWPVKFQEWNEESIWAGGMFGGDEENAMNVFDEWFAELKKLEDEVTVAVTSNGLLRLLGKRFLGAGNGPYGVWTGYACVLETADEPIVMHWNVQPSEIL